MRTVELPSGQAMPVLGMGTWRMGENSSHFESEVAALRSGLDLGISLIDTAEMYGEGGAEEVVAEAIANRRSETFLVSKVYPHNASKKGAIAACERSLKRLKTDYLDLYLLHWRGSVPLTETLAAFETLKAAGKIRAFGVSNFDVADMEEAAQLLGEQSGSGVIATNQVLYNLTRRGVEWDLLPWCERRGIPVMAYSPIEQGRLLSDRTLRQVADARGVSAAQVALAWVLQQENVVAIPKASRVEHIQQNYDALSLQLNKEEIETLDSAFPKPNKAVPLEML